MSYSEPGYFLALLRLRVFIANMTRSGQDTFHSYTHTSGLLWRRPEVISLAVPVLRTIV